MSPADRERSLPATSCRQRAHPEGVTAPRGEVIPHCSVEPSIRCAGAFKIPVMAQTNRRDASERPGAVLCRKGSARYAAAVFVLGVH